MSRLRSGALALAALPLLLAGCDAATDGATGAALAPVPTAELATVPATATVNGYTVEYLGATAVAAGTRFAYRVTGIAPGPPALDWLFLENACGAAPVATTPANAVDPTASEGGMPGVRWTASLPSGSTRDYAVTVADAEVGVARVVIRRGGATETAALPGPCGGYRLAGSVFVDGDGDPARAADELGRGGVRVEVHDADGLVSAEQTGPDGSFAFDLAEGAYEVRVPSAAPGAFNAVLFASYGVTGGGEARRAVALTADVSGVDLGFTPDGGAIIADLTEGAYVTRARDVKFWQRAVREARRDRPCDAADPDAVCRPALEGLLAQIFSADGDGAYLLDDPYALPAGADPLDHAANLLGGRTRTPLETVTRNLFAMELNRLNGWGSPDPAYDDALMAYLEGWVARGGTGAATSAASARQAGSGLQAAAAKDGGGGGGGGVEEGMSSAYLGGGGGGGGVED